MAPRLALSKIQLICDILSNWITIPEVASTVECSRQSVHYIQSNLEQFGSARAPLIRTGRPRIITSEVLKALCDYLIEKPTLYLHEMAVFVWDEFNIRVTTSSISRALASIGWSKKTARSKAKERNQDLRDEYRHHISDFQQDQLIFVDEYGCDKRVGFRRTGWSPLGTTPTQICKFHREQRHQILSAYAQDGIVLSRIFQGSTDAAIFEDFIEQLLRHCGKWPEPKSVLIMDNASFHHSERLEEICATAGVSSKHSSSEIGQFSKRTPVKPLVAS